MTERPKTPGQIAYEEDVRRLPFYDFGRMYHRDPWDKISETARRSWELDPTPRDWRKNVGDGEEVTK